MKPCAIYIEILSFIYGHQACALRNIWWATSFGSTGHLLLVRRFAFSCITPSLCYVLPAVLTRRQLTATFTFQNSTPSGATNDFVCCVFQSNNRTCSPLINNFSIAWCMWEWFTSRWPIELFWICTRSHPYRITTGKETDDNFFVAHRRRLC